MTMHDSAVISSGDFESEFNNKYKSPAWVVAENGMVMGINAEWVELLVKDWKKRGDVLVKQRNDEMCW